MNRENLLKNLCPSKNIDLCRSETKKIDCIDCNNVMNTYLDEYDKHIIAECEAEHGNLADMIRDIHDCVSMEMYRKGIDDFVEEFSIELSESIIWGLISSKNSLNDKSDLIVGYIMREADRVANKLKDKQGVKGAGQ